MFVNSSLHFWLGHLELSTAQAQNTNRLGLILSSAPSIWQ